MKYVTWFIIFIFVVFSAKSQTWQPLGPDNREELGFGFARLLWTTQHAGTLYAAMLAPGSGSTPNKLIIKKYSGAKWDTVGTSIPSAVVSSSNFSLTLDNTGTPYSFVQDPVTGFTVKKCVNGTWMQVGANNFISGSVTSSNIKTAKADTPYVLVTEGGKVTVMKFNGTVWDSVGNKKFVTTTGAATIGFDTTGIPYVVYSDPANLNRATVMKFNGLSWSTVSPFGGLSTLGASSYEMKVDSLHNQMYLKYYDTALGTTVKKYDGVTWSSVGTLGMTSGFADNLYINRYGVPYLSLRRADSAWVTKFDGSIWKPITVSVKNTLNQPASLTFTQDTIPLLGYHYPAYGGKPVISDYDGGLWTKKGTYGFIAGGVPNYATTTLPATNRLLTTVTSNNIPYVVFSDSAYGGKLSIMKFMNGNWTYEGTPGFTSALSNPVQFEKGRNDTLFVMYGQTGIAGYKLAYFDGSTFVNVGSGLSSQTYPVGTALALDTASVPYVIYPDPSNFSITTLKKLVNGNWSTTANLPCTTSVQMKINKKNEVYAMYNSGTGANIVSNLVKFTNGSWTTPVQSPLQGLLKIAPNDSVYLLLMKLYSYTSGGGQIPTTYSYYQKELHQFSSNNWNFITSFYVTSSTVSPPPPVISESYINLVFDTSSIPYVSVVTRDSVSVKAFVSGSWINATTITRGWHSNIKAPNFDIAFGPNNDLIAAYSQGTAYALMFQPGMRLPAPQVVSPVSYCQGDTASPLIAIGQNLSWGPTAPTPSTLSPGTYMWGVTQTSGFYPSPTSSIIIVVNPKPTINPVIYAACTGDTVYLSTPIVPGATYNWTSIRYINGASLINSFDSTSTLPVTDSGFYMVTVTPNGCKSDTTTIIIRPFLYPTIAIASPVNQIVGQNVTVIASVMNAPHAYAIDWFINGGLYTTTNTDTLIYTKAPGADTIVAVVRSSVAYPCYVPDTSNVQIVDELTNITDVLLRAGIAIYPNPFTDVLDIKGVQSGDDLLLFSAEGKVMKRWVASGSGIETIDMKQLSTGSYFLRIVNERAILNIPLIKL